MSITTFMCIIGLIGVFCSSVTSESLLEAIGKTCMFIMLIQILIKLYDAG